MKSIGTRDAKAHKMGAVEKERTQFAREVQDGIEAKSVYLQWCKYAEAKVPLMHYELVTGSFAVAVKKTPDFWIAVFKSKKKAENFIAEWQS